MPRKNVVILTGAGISAESDISTFRDIGGLWEKYDVMELASPQGWAANPGLVLEFYNVRRKKVREAKPNAAHFALKLLEKQFNILIITQNVDDLHERAGSSQVLHLHGEILKARSSVVPCLTYTLGDKDIHIGDLCEKGSQLRPDVVWFGESVPLFEKAVKLCESADIFIVIGTSLAVYPAANLIYYVPSASPKYIIDKTIPAVSSINNLTRIEKPATEGVTELVNELLTLK
jgi:NAD-dependent deacetylase